MLGMDADDSLEENQLGSEYDDKQSGDGGPKSFLPLTALCYLLMLPKYMLMDRLIRKEVGNRTGSSGGNNETSSIAVWSIIWGLFVPNKVKLFLGRADHAFLPYVERLFKCKVCSSYVCGRCGCASESVIHILWECRIAQKVWEHTWLAGVVKLWRYQSLVDLLHRVVKEGTHKELEFFGLVFWWIWKSRNNTIHGLLNPKLNLKILVLEQTLVSNPVISMGNNDEDSDGHSADLEEEEKQRKEEVSDYETITDWVSSQGESTTSADD
ncbi:hypothetical protein ACLB2K_059736 [Fragaria x ananassa]